MFRVLSMNARRGWPPYLLVASLILLPSLGCKSEFPPVTQLKIKVMLKGSGKPMAGGTVELESVEDPTLKGFGDIGDDGVADIVTYRNQKEIPGVVSGDHRVRIEARRESGVRIPVKYKDFDSSGLKITIPNASNPIILEIEGTGP